MISGLMEAGRSGYVSDATKEINNLIEQFKKIDWNYVVSSVIICVVVPALIYAELIYGIIKMNW